MEHPDTDVRLQVELAAAPLLAWRFLTDHEFLPSWYPGVSRLDRRSASRMVEHRRIVPLLPFAVPLPVRIVDSRPGESFAVRARLGLLTVDGRYDLAAREDGATEVVIGYGVRPATRLAEPAAMVARRVLARDGRAQADAMAGGFESWLRERS